MKRLLAFFIICAALLSVPFTVRAADAAGAEPGVDEETAGPLTASDMDFTAELTLYANASYLVNMETGRVIYEHNASERVYPASTTKIMSAALALLLCDDPANTVVTLPENLWEEFYGIDISHAGLSGGEELTVEQLVHCMLLQSANEAASGIAAYYGGQDFIDLMNDKARSLGCGDTHFVNAHGLYDENHYTTAEDMYKITEWAISVPGFLEAASKARYDIPATNKNGEKTLATTVLMQDRTSGYYTSYIRGIKTGTIDESGRCLVSFAEKNGMSYCLVLMGCPLENTEVFWSDGRSVFNEARIIYDWMFENAALENVVNPDTTVTEIELRYAPKKDSIVLYPEGELSAVIRRNSGLSAEVRYEIEVPEYIEAPVSEGQTVGAAKVYADGIFLGEVRLVARESAEFSWFIMAMEKMKTVLGSGTAYIVYAVLAAVVLFYFYYIRVLIHRDKSRVKKRRAAKSKRR